MLFLFNVSQVQEALEEVLEQGIRVRYYILHIIGLTTLFAQDDDLAAMYLTDKKSGKERVPADHEELEVLLESFAKQVEEIVNEAETISVCEKNYSFQSDSIISNLIGKRPINTRNRRAYTRFQPKFTTCIGLTGEIYLCLLSMACLPN